MHWHSWKGESPILRIRTRTGDMLYDNEVPFIYGPYTWQMIVRVLWLREDDGYGELVEDEAEFTYAGLPYTELLPAANQLREEMLETVQQRSDFKALIDMGWEGVLKELA